MVLGEWMVKGYCNPKAAWYEPPERVFIFLVRMWMKCTVRNAIQTIGIIVTIFKLMHRKWIFDF